MFSLLRLPLILLEMALRGGVGAIVRLLGGGGDDARPYAPVERPDPSAARRTRRSWRRRRHARARPAARPARPAPTAAPPRSAPEAELLGEEPAHVTRGAEPVASFGPADDPSPTLHVQAPWDGYDAHPAAEVIKRVRAADEATKAVVLLYEQGHKARASVIRAAGGQRATA